MNILDLDDNILDMIGEIVKRDNRNRISKEETFKYMDRGLEYLKEENKYNKEEIGEMLYDRLFKCGECSDEYLESRGLDFNMFPEKKK